jgi:hypothetical protein
VPKHEKTAIENVAVNDGQHMHTVSLIPPESRMSESFSDHIEEEQDRYTNGPYL